MTKISSKSIVLWVTVISAGFFIFQLAKDFLEAKWRGYGYYFSESFLFAFIWILLIPFVLSIRKFDWNKRSKKTIFLISLALSILHLCLYALMVWIISALFMDVTFVVFGNVKFGFLEYSSLLFLSYFLIITLFKYYSREEIIHPISDVRYSQHLILNKGGTKEYVPVENIICLQASTPYVQVVTGDKKYLEKLSLKDLLKNLDPSVFIRIHKSSIINLKKISSFTSRMNGDYDITMDNGIQVRMSRNYTQDFKRLLKQDAPSS